METDGTKRQDIPLQAPHGPIARIIFGGLGAAIIAVVLYDLGPALWPVGWWSLFFAVIVIGACWIGVICLMAGIIGDDVTWTLGHSEMRFDRKSPWRSRTEVVRPGEVLATDIETHDWESRPETFSVRMHLRSGQIIDTPQVDSRVQAEALQAEIRSRLAVA